MKINKNFIDKKATLYLVSTPIGNLEDITLRAVNTLKSVDLIFCEDTRVSLKLLNHLEIKKKIYSYHEHNKIKQGKLIIEALKENKNVAILSDAGMPVISDPGYEIVKEALALDFSVVPLPGANAALTALIASGIAPNSFTFFGFLDSKESKKRKQLASLKDCRHTLIFYESVHRIKNTLEIMYEVFKERDAVIARELTKKFEEFTFGKLSELAQNIQQLKGELVLIVSASDSEELLSFDISIKEHIETFIEIGEKTNEAIKKVAKLRRISKQEAYNEYHNLKK